ncbi:ATPase [Marinicrinis sediminis]|uniref:ATPase n=1 Tax=Marinicrinis sediminis TaxID=1652465 RepID=A0ABW5RBT7_9BACL
MKLGQKVIIIQDRFEQGLPVGKHAYVIAYERNQDNVFDYIIRIPHVNKHFGVPRDDIELEEVLLEEAVEQVQREALIDYALATKNEELFRKILRGEDELSEEEENSEKLLSQQEFIRQVNLRAWI